MENWKEIKECEGAYLVSDMGNVKSSYSNIVMKSELNWGSYPRVKLYFNGKYHSRSIHRLVATAFLENLENKREVNHKNRVKTDNRLENLEWVTAKENILHSFENPDRKSTKGRVSEKRKAVIYFDKEKMTEYFFSCIDEACLRYGLSYHNIYNRCNGIIRKDKNWRYA